VDSIIPSGDRTKLGEDTVGANVVGRGEGEGEGGLHVSVACRKEQKGNNGNC